jgi:glutamate-1-semialdehyde 2,1-aminomutase/spore coat polysaccharide biosynthesis protein SpsF
VRERIFMTLAIIVQARAGSSRLPGKVLEPLGAASVLARVLARCRRLEGLDDLVCAVPDSAGNDAVAAEAKACGAHVVRGSETDVLSRYADAARAVGADEVVRVTSDCPFFDPEVCRQVVALLRESGADYANNTMIAGFPQGLDCEAFPAELLFKAERQAKAPADREHVTAWMRRQHAVSMACLRGPGGDAGALRWTLDYPEDLDFCRAVFERLGDARAAWIDYPKLAALCRSTPELAAINAAHADPSRASVAAAASIVRDYTFPQAD